MPLLPAPTVRLLPLLLLLLLPLFRPAASGAAEIPLTVLSTEEQGEVRAEIAGRIDLPFVELMDALSDPAAWCDFVPLNLNVKACTWQREPEGARLSFYAGRKFYQPPEDATRIDYRFRVTEAGPERLQIALESISEPLGMEDGRIILTAEPAGTGTSLLLVSSLDMGLAGRLATRGYLATLGRHKVGFTQTGRGADGPEYVGGLRGMVERNAMRYYLAVEAFFASRDLPEGERFENRLRTWFDRTEDYPRQLRELEREEYLAAKRRERTHQLRLQEELQQGD